MSVGRPNGAGELLLGGVVTTCRRGLLAAAFFSLGVNLLMLTLPFYMLQLFDRVLMSRSIDTLLMLSLIAGGALVALAMLDTFRGLLIARLGGWVERRLGGYVLAGHVAVAAERGAISVQGLRDLALIRTFLSGPGMVPLLDAPWIPIFLLATALLHPLLGLVATGGAFGLLTLVLATGIATRRPTQRAIGLAVESTDAAEESVRNAELIEAIGMLPAAIRRWQRRQEEAYRLQGRAASRGLVIGALSKLLRFGLQLSVLGVGAYLAIDNAITAGAMVAASILTGRALAPLEMAIGGWRSAVGAFAAYRRLRRQLETAPIARSAMALTGPVSALTVEAVSYGYPDQGRPLLKSVSLALEPGQALGILGPIGAGKTTLARLLTGTLSPQLGQVRLAGAEVAGLLPDDRRQTIGYLPQDAALLRGSVRDNIARFEEVSDDEVVAAARLAGAHEMILRLPQGYASEVGEGGRALSGGQRQWIALARAVLSTPKLLVLDEPAAGLDPPGEAALIEAVKRLKAMGGMIVVLAHRGALLQQMDGLLLLSNGRLERLAPLRRGSPTAIAAPAAAGWPRLAESGSHG